MQRRAGRSADFIKTRTGLATPTNPTLTAMSTAAVTALLLLAALTPAAWAANEFILLHRPLVVTRLDPIVAPGGLSSHAHVVYGGSKFSGNVSGNELVSSQCSTVPTQADKSNYWIPQLYFRHPNATLIPLLSSGLVYYHVNDDGGRTKVEPFPPGLRMLVGDAMRRHREPTQKTASFQSRCGLHREQFHTQPLIPDARTYPERCSMIHWDIDFPSCGLASRDLDSDDHFSHMAFPVDGLVDGKFGQGSRYNTRTGKYCPDSHPVHYPTIHFEVDFMVDDSWDWSPRDDMFVLANGDTTGYTFHADFINGWDQDILERMIKECAGDNNPTDRGANCAIKNELTNDTIATNCAFEGRIVDEWVVRWMKLLTARDVGFYRPLDKLPGCNPLWTDSMPDTKPECKADNEDPALVHPNAFFLKPDMSCAGVSLLTADSVPAPRARPALRPRHEQPVRSRAVGIRGDGGDRRVGHARRQQGQRYAGKH
ncbi:uncharacterized protein LOC62_02G002120 [Vanrija pseudolonga]|uniref:DUF1996 domain-containing protein n=1 Tax=Vanrija pseudolonga TaxID=143232 RepID=A0AAF0Y1V3_9TREE|nr:hypothetical protein LOC62_02G002120 [Vanrija pseudolonga]